MNELDNIIAVVGYLPRPSHEDGWYSFSELYEEVKKDGISQEGFRRKLTEKAQAEELEKITWGKNSFYRIKK